MPPQSKLRVTFVGDSSLEGAGIKDVDLRFANRIRHANDWDVQVLGVAGSSTADEIRLLLKCFSERQYETDMVVLVYDPNDIADLAPDMIKWTNEGFLRVRRLQENALLRQSRLFEQAATHFVVNRYLNMGDYVRLLIEAYDGPPWKRQEIRLKLLDSLCHDHGAQLLVVTASGACPRQLQALCDELRVPCLDLTPLEQEYGVKKMTVSSTDGHPSEFAHGLFAERIAPLIEANIRRGARRPLGERLAAYAKMLDINWFDDKQLSDGYADFQIEHLARESATTAANK